MSGWLYFRLDLITWASPSGMWGINVAVARYCKDSVEPCCGSGRRQATLIAPLSQQAHFTCAPVPVPPTSGYSLDPVSWHKDLGGGAPVLL